MRYLLPSHCNIGCTKAPQCYIIRTLPVLLYPQLVPHREHCLSHPAYFRAFKRDYYCVTQSLSHTGLLHRVDCHQRGRCSCCYYYYYYYYCHVCKGGFRNSKHQAWERVVIKGPDVSLGPRHRRRKSVAPPIVACFLVSTDLYVQTVTSVDCWLNWEVELISSL